jgi:hypothetical protein
MVPIYSTGAFGRASVAIAVSALFTLAIVQSSRAPQAPNADETLAQVDAPQAAVDSASAELEVGSAELLQAQIAPQPARVAAAQPAKTPAPKPAKPHAAVAVAAPQPVVLAVAAPLPLQPPRIVQTAPKRPVLARMVSTVGQISGLVRDSVEGAAAWVGDLPRDAISKLPLERRFL